MFVHKPFTYLAYAYLKKNVFECEILNILSSYEDEDTGRFRNPH